MFNYDFFIEIKQCYISEDPTEQCTGTNCAAQLSRQNQEYEIERDCINDEYMGIYYTLFLDLQSRDNEEKLMFSCNYNRCNNQSNFANIISKFGVHYQINDVLKTINPYKRSEESEDVETTTTTTTTTLKSTTKTTTTTTSLKSITITTRATPTTLKSTTITTTTATTTTLKSTTQQSTSLKSTTITTTTATTTTLKSTTQQSTSLKTTTTTTNPQGNSGFKYTIHMAIFYISLIRFVLLH